MWDYDPDRATRHYAPSTAPPMQYVETDLRTGETLAEWRKRTHPVKVRRRLRLIVFLLNVWRG